MLLLSARHREVVTATLVLEALLPLGMLGVPGLLASLTFAAGAGSPEIGRASCRERVCQYV